MRLFLGLLYVTAWSLNKFSVNTFIRGRGGGNGSVLTAETRRCCLSAVCVTDCDGLYCASKRICIFRFVALNGVTTHLSRKFFLEIYVWKIVYLNVLTYLFTCIYERKASKPDFTWMWIKLMKLMYRPSGNVCSIVCVQVLVTWRRHSLLTLKRSLYVCHGWHRLNRTASLSAITSIRMISSLTMYEHVCCFQRVSLKSTSMHVHVRYMSSSVCLSVCL